MPHLQASRALGLSPQIIRFSASNGQSEPAISCKMDLDIMPNQCLRGS
jgi:hypothetical protein